MALAALLSCAHATAASSDALDPTTVSESSITIFPILW
jgi:hypothetical protein